MGADWYEPDIFYGFKIIIPKNKNYRTFAKQLLKKKIPFNKPFDIRGFLPSFHSRMEGGDNSDLDDYAVLVIGFNPPNDLTLLLDYANKLNEEIKEKLNFVKLAAKSAFYTGIDWSSSIEDSIYDDEYNAKHNGGDYEEEEEEEEENIY